MRRDVLFEDKVLTPGAYFRGATVGNETNYSPWVQRSFLQRELESLCCLSSHPIMANTV